MSNTLLRGIIFVLIYWLVLTNCFMNNLFAREWADPVRLTFTQGERMQVPYNACVDVSDNVYLLYHLEDAEGIRNKDEDVFLRINLPTGERVGPLYPFGEDCLSSAFGRMLVDTNGSVHIVSICRFPDLDYEYYYTRLSSNGEVEVEPSRLDGLWQHWFGITGEYGDGRGPYLRLLPDGNLIWYARSNRNRQNGSGYLSTLTYTRITPEGEMLDSTRILHQEETEEPGRLVWEQFTVDSNGNIYCTWRKNTAENGGAYLTIVDANDSLIVDNLRLEGLGGYDLVQDISVADDGSIYLARQRGNPLVHRLETYGHKLDRQLNHQLYVELGIFNRLAGFTAIDYENGRVAVLNSPIEDAPEDHFYGYIEFGDNGEILDSLQYPPTLAVSASPEVCLSNGTAYCFVLQDSLPRQVDIWLIKSESNNGVEEKWSILLPTEIEVNLYPNPFNNQVSLTFSLEVTANAKLTIHDLTGREIASLVDTQLAEGLHQQVWNAEALPSGLYFACLNAGGKTSSVKMTLLK